VPCVNRPFGAAGSLLAFPNAEALGYFQSSLRDGVQILVTVDESRARSDTCARQQSSRKLTQANQRPCFGPLFVPIRNLSLPRAS
jgi:hypothetical protein